MAKRKATVEDTLDPIMAARARAMEDAFHKQHPRLRRPDIVAVPEDDAWIIVVPGATYRGIFIGPSHVAIARVDERDHTINLERAVSVEIPLPPPDPAPVGFNPQAQRTDLDERSATLTHLDDRLGLYFKGHSLDLAHEIATLAAEAPAGAKDWAGRSVNHTATLTQMARNGALEAVVLLERFRTAIAEAQARAAEMQPIIRAALRAAREAQAQAGVLPLSHQKRVSTVEVDLNQCEDANATLQRHAAAMAKQRDRYEPLVRTHVVAVLTVVRQARQAWCRDTLAMLRDKALELRAESESERLAREAVRRFDPDLLREVPQITWGEGPLDPPTLA
jgi:hypothetical protein